MFPTTELPAQAGSSKTSESASPLAALAVPSSISSKVKSKLPLNKFAGLWNAPRKQRILGGLTHVRNRAPFLGGKKVVSLKKKCREFRDVGRGLFVDGLFADLLQTEG